MATYKNKPYQKKAFESTGVSDDTSANIYMSMLVSAAWRTLTANQQRLYMYCKAQYYGMKTKEKTKLLLEWPELKDEAPDMLFSMNKSKWCSLYRLYSDNNRAAFIRDMTALIDNGFISCAACGAVGRKKTVYRFSSMWQKYGTEQFHISPSDKTVAMLGFRKLKKEE